MTTEQRIKTIVERNIPLNPTCATKRKEQILQRVQLRLQIEELVRSLALEQYEPRTVIK